MKLEDMLLKHEEIELRVFEGCHMNIPIHPRLIEDKDLRFDEELAYDTFRKIAKEWYDELVKYAEDLPDGNEKGVLKDYFLDEEFELYEEYGIPKVRPGGWPSSIFFDERGFAISICTDRNHGGTMYVPPERDSCNLMPMIIKFSKEKFEEYTATKYKKSEINYDYGTSGYAYIPHNTDFYPGSLLMKHWAIEYLNSCLKQVFEK